MFALIYSGGLCGIFINREVINNIIKKYDAVKFIIIKLNTDLNLDESNNLNAYYYITIRDNVYPLYLSTKENCIKKLEQLQYFNIAEDIYKIHLGVLNDDILNIMQNKSGMPKLEDIENIDEVVYMEESLISDE